VNGLFDYVSCLGGSITRNDSDSAAGVGPSWGIFEHTVPPLMLRSLLETGFGSKQR